MKNIENYKIDLQNLIELGNSLLTDLKSRKTNNKKRSANYRNLFEKKYQNWYTISISVIQQIIPQRLNEFENLYLADPKRKITNHSTYSIQDWINGYRLFSMIVPDDYDSDDIDIVISKFITQINILESASERFKNSLFEIRNVAQAELFDSEIDAAKDLLKNGFIRPAGIIAGVLLEKYLNEVWENNKIKVCKKNPSISDYNDLLKNNNIYEIPQWRTIQWLGDVRNLCGHNKNGEPTKDNVLDLINGVEKVIKTIF